MSSMIERAVDQTAKETTAHVPPTEHCSAPEVVRRPGVYVKTFGCQMNEWDSERILALLAPQYRPVQRVEEAEVVIVNTCSVREKAERKLYDVLGVLRQLKGRRPGLIIGVGGCVAQQEGVEILRRNRAVDFIVGTHNLSLVPSLVEAAKRGAPPQVAVDYREEWEDLPPEFDALPPPSELLKGERMSSFGAYYSPVRALVAIQRGCNKGCSYCVVPRTRGTEVSRLPGEIEREIRQKVRLGAREVMLLGQTVNSYGRDLTPRSSFSELIRRVAAIDGVKRIRFTSPHPAEVRADFLRLYAEIPQLMPHIHLPVQSGNDRILRLMNRNYRVRRYREIVAALRSVRPDIAITTDIIVGFPTETECEFRDTFELVREMRYHQLFVFQYSPRPNTPAIERFQGAESVPPAVGEARLREILDLQREISRDLNRALLGTEVEVLVEAPGRQISLFRGRTAHNTPAEIVSKEEGISQLRGTFQLGDTVRGKVVYASPYGLRVDIITDECHEPSERQ